MGDRPGQEIPKDYRKVVVHLIDNEAWTYRRATRWLSEAHPADPTHRPIRLPKTPSSPRTLENFVAEVRRKGGHWPPRR